MHMNPVHVKSGVQTSQEEPDEEESQWNSKLVLKKKVPAGSL